ncbi:hypothetical protein [Paenibacillus hunanensis]|nr:hypothetical protein [Paenibacillus hunanensis]MCL9660367.1 hypothetical protein [Paenibacillus hunanensis]
MKEKLLPTIIDVKFKHQLNQALQNGQSLYDTSINRQKEVLKALNKNTEQIVKLCQEIHPTVMTEIKLINNVSTNQFKADYQYDLIYSNDPVKDADDVAEEWFEALRVK